MSFRANEFWMNSLRSDHVPRTRFTESPRTRLSNPRRPLRTEVERPQYYRYRTRTPGRYGRNLDVEVEVVETDKRTSNLQTDLLEVSGVDLYVSQNTTSHHTDKYSQTRKGKLIVRRAQEIRFRVTLNRSYKRDQDVIRFIFDYTAARNPLESEGSQVVVPLSNSATHSGKWKGQILQIGANWITAMISPSADTPIGEWTFRIETARKEEKRKKGNTPAYTHPFSIFILFNPWAKEDAVFLAGQDRKTEYVLADSGQIYQCFDTKDGDCHKEKMDWVFGQFERDVLEAVFYAIHHEQQPGKRLKLSVKDMGDPVKIARHLPYVICGGKFGGVLQGNWRSESEMEVIDPSVDRHATAWSSSVQILRLYYERKQVVRYGQCWVFAGLLNTMCRAIGLPSRIITCFSAGHESDREHLALNLRYDVDGELIESESEQIWNFHVWNEVWMRREDLKATGAYDGWQVIDATPQEQSDGAYRCGPMSVKALRTARIDLSYDGLFIAGEFNADIYKWRRYDDGRPDKLVSKDTAQIGKELWTIDSVHGGPKEVTDDYKPKERSHQERTWYQESLRRASGGHPLRRLGQADFKDVEFEIPAIEAQMGQTFYAAVIVTNNSEKMRYNINLRLLVDAGDYTGRDTRKIKHSKDKIILEPNQQMTLEMEVPFKEYYHSEMAVDTYSFTVSANVLEVDFDFIKTNKFHLELPELVIECEDRQVVGRSFSVLLSFSNPLPRSLTNAYFTIESPGITKHTVYRVRNAAAHETMETIVDLVPKGKGRRTLIVNLYTDELKRISASKDIMVREATGSRFDSNHL